MSKTQNQWEKQGRWVWSSWMWHITCWEGKFRRAYASFQVPRLQNFIYSYNFFNGEPSTCLALPAFDDRQNCLLARPSQLPAAQCKAFVSKKIHCSAFKCHPFIPTLPPPPPSPPVPVPSSSVPFLVPLLHRQFIHLHGRIQARNIQLLRYQIYNNLMINKAQAWKISDT